MEKEQIISLIKSEISQGNISKEDIINSLEVKELETKDHSSKIINILYAVGGVIALIGVVILVSQYWNEIGIFGRILVTLGISIVTYIAALIYKKYEQNIISQIMFVMSAVLAPIGTYVMFKEADIKFDWLPQAITAVVLAVIYCAAFAVVKRNILPIIITAFGSWAYFAILSELLNFDISSTAVKMSILILGAAYVLLAYNYHLLKTEGHDGEIKSVKGLLYLGGTVAVLGAGISFGGAFDIVFIALLFAVFYTSVFVRSTTMLLAGAGFLIAHIIKLTSKYFADSVGWPLALIVVGFLVIGVGYLTVYLNRKFIK